MAVDSAQPEPPDDSDASENSTLIRDTLLLGIGALAAVVVVSALFGPWVEALASRAVGTFGLAGMFAGVFAAGTFNLPPPPDAYLLVGVAAETGVVATLVTCSAAAVVAGHAAYLLGPWIESVPFLGQRLETYRPRAEELISDWGFWGVGAAALTPLPFSVVCWLAGLYKMHYGAFAVAALFRIPRICGYYALYRAGWAIGF